MRPPPARFTTKVVGVTFVDGYPDNLHTLKIAHESRFDDMLRRRAERSSVPLWADWGYDVEPLPAILDREPDNPHDENAVVVSSPTVGVLGHLPRYVATLVAPWLDAGHRMRVGIGAVLVTPGAEEQPGVSLVVERLDDSDGSDGVV